MNLRRRPFVHPWCSRILIAGCAQRMSCIFLVLPFCLLSCMGW